MRLSDPQTPWGIAEKWALTIFQLPALFDENQGTAIVDCQDLAVFRYSAKRAVGIHDTHGIAVHAKRWLSEAEARRDDAAQASLTCLANICLPSNRCGTYSKTSTSSASIFMPGLSSPRSKAVGELLC